MTVPKTLGEIAGFLKGELDGPADLPIRGIEALVTARADQISFVVGPRYREEARQSRAGALILPFSWTEKADRPVVRVADPYVAYARLASAFTERPFVPLGVSPMAHVGTDCRIDPEVSVYPWVYIGDRSVVGPRVTLYPGAYLGDDVVIGEGSTVHPNAVLYSGSRVGCRVVLHAGAVIGSDGFGYSRDGECHVKIPQLGSVVVEDDVEVGANTTIDRAAFGNTVIGRGTKIDNLVQIGHNVRIGPHSVLVAQVGISGSSRLGRGVVLGGQAGVAGHIELGDGVMVGAQAGIAQAVPKGEVVSGTPAMPHRTWLRVVQAMKRLPNVLRDLRELSARVERLEASEGRERLDRQGEAD